MSPDRVRVRPRGTAVLGAAALLVALATACTVGPSQRPPVAVRGDHLAPPPSAGPRVPAGPRALPRPEPGISTIDFVDCTDDLGSVLTAPLPPDRALRIECGTLAVPVDPQRPAAPTT
ncbi:MAG: hypothetical protein L0H84_12925, partial [Pseudonocardia sp.]|nr:hypothetical protein [Pseudonocardia sp.]